MAMDRGKKEEKRFLFATYQLGDSYSMSTGLFKISKFKIIHCSAVCRRYKIINDMHVH